MIKATEKKAPKTSSVITPFPAKDKAGIVSPDNILDITITKDNARAPNDMALYTLFFEPFSLFKASITGINKATDPKTIVIRDGVENKSIIVYYHHSP
jgi:hypothetical protein